jgi:hypothetical protein
MKVTSIKFKPICDWQQNGCDFYESDAYGGECYNAKTVCHRGTEKSIYECTSKGAIELALNQHRTTREE